jgi:hypothetical protein
MSRYRYIDSGGGQFGEDDYPPSRQAALSEAEFEVFIMGTLTVWVSSLFLLVLKSEHVLALGPSDLSPIGEVAASLAGLALALLGVVHQLNLANTLLKLGLGFLTFVLLLSTFLVTGAYARYVDQFTCAPEVTLWVVSLAGATLVPMLIRRLFLLKRNTRGHTISPDTGRGWARDLAYALPLLTPVPLLASVQGECRLLAYSVLLLALGLIGIMALLLVFVFKAYLKPSEPIEEMKRTLIRIFKRARERHYDTSLPADADDDKLLIPLSDLLEEPELFHSSRSLVDRALLELVDTNHIYKDEANGAYYHLPEAEEIDEVLAYVKSHPVVVYRQHNDGSVVFEKLRLVKELARQYRFPPSVVKTFLKGRLDKLIATDYFTGLAPNGWQIYVRKGDRPCEDVLALWTAWMTLNERRADETGLDPSVVDGADTKAKYDDFGFSIPPRDVRLMQEVKKTAPVSSDDLLSEDGVKVFFSKKILPKGLLESLKTSDDLYEFLEALERRVRDLRAEVPASHSARGETTA